MSTEIAEQISQRDLRLRYRDIMDAVERGEAFTVTRDGRPMGQLVPLLRRFETRERFAVVARGAGVMDERRFRQDLDAYLDDAITDPYEH